MFRRWVAIPQQYRAASLRDITYDAKFNDVKKLESCSLLCLQLQHMYRRLADNLIQISILFYSDRIFRSEIRLGKTQFLFVCTYSENCWQKYTNVNVTGIFTYCTIQWDIYIYHRSVIFFCYRTIGLSNIGLANSEIIGLSATGSRPRSIRLSDIGLTILSAAHLCLFLLNPFLLCGNDKYQCEIFCTFLPFSSHRKIGA